MKEYEATEIAYKNGYEQCRKDAVKRLMVFVDKYKGTDKGKAFEFATKIVLGVPSTSSMTCVFCGKPTEGSCVCHKCQPKMYEYPSMWKKIWSAIKSTFKR